MRWIETRNKDLIEAYLRRDTASHVYAIADLDDFFWPETTWYALVEGDAFEAVALLLGSLQVPVLYAVCPPDHAPTIDLLHAIRSRLPDRFYANFGPGLELALRRFWKFEPLGEHQKMVRADRAPALAVDTTGVDPIGLEELQTFYEDTAYLENEKAGRFFEPYMLEMGPYVGVREAGELMCAGGVHVVSHRRGVAALANIATRPDRRGRGLGRRVTAKLCQELDSIEVLGLNVDTDNEPAIRCYEALGFRVACPFREGYCERVGDVDTRSATEDDFEFLYRVHREAMGTYVAETWGWNEAFQRDFFRARWSPADRRVVRVGGEDAGCLRVEEREDCVVLRYVALLERFQRAGVGTKLVQQVLERGRERGVPVRLDVLKVNPVRKLYERLGFEITGGDDVRHTMEAR